MWGGGYALIVGGMIIGGGIGTFIAMRIQMTALPQLVAAFHSLVGLAAVFVAAAALNAPAAFGIGVPGTSYAESLIEMSLGLAIGAITFTGSIIAFSKLQGIMKGAPINFPMQHQFNLGIGVLLVVLIVIFVITQAQAVFWLIAFLAFAMGFLIIIPIGGADMPVVISMLNSYSGWAACGIGFTIQNVGADHHRRAGRRIGRDPVLCHVQGHEPQHHQRAAGWLRLRRAAAAAVAGASDRTVKSGNAEDAAFIMKNASKVIVVPGYGMAVAQAQHALREMADVLKEQGVEVKYAIHPVAGRMPGHMNVLLAEANVPYDEVFELEQINNEFATADVAYVIGANDVTNPAAKTDRASPIYGMPILEVEKAGTVLFVKRSMASGYAGVENELFFRPNTMMLFGDAKKMTEEIVQALGR